MDQCTKEWRVGEGSDLSAAERGGLVNELE
jgi:hypothetical protein